MKTNIKKNGKSNFFQISKPKAIIYALLLFLLSAFALTANFPNRGIYVLIVNASFNTALIISMYLVACFLVMIFDKVRGK